MDTEDPLSGSIHSFIKTAVIATVMWKPWIARIVAIVQLDFWTMVAIAMIIWKPWIAKIVAIVQLYFWTMVSIAMIMWKLWITRIVAIMQLNVWPMVAMETMDGQDRRNRAIKFLANGGLSQ